MSEAVTLRTLRTSQTSQAPRTWFLTGASPGLGEHWAAVILARGDRLAATARDKAALASLSEQYGDRFLPL
ncbi:hypothetical protein [Amycolatopsis sp. FDAARGOS 1241]|uniref:hypothetical protein n=1 Tax=Amycolatopsis sp. FDAARGOS 1241 TaxID=2778070 RepID=UPI00194E3B7B|nr:hypothetical protein [Amycolatopsis sp. FDAARGOS 1241]QRP48353.1 hypothetical protein I6J71_11135 [Amycolatopsis sp. FDAARGOS 1241]